MTSNSAVSFRPTQWVTRKSSVMGAVLLALASGALASSVPLSTGVLVDVTVGRAWVSDASGYVQNIALDTGKSLWTSAERALPVAELDGRIIALGSAKNFGQGVLVVLDASSGALLDRVSFDVPETVDADFAPRPLRKFSMTAQSSGQGVRLSWQFEGRPLRGAALLEASPGEEPTLAPLTQAQGALEFVRDRDAYFATPLRGLSAVTTSQSPDLPAAERLPGLQGVQFRSADAQTVLTSTPASPSSGAQRYDFKLFNRAGRALGGYSSPYSYTPFVLTPQILVLQTPPFAEAAGPAHGAQLQGVNLQSGQIRWSFDILDSEFRGQLPP
jgi:hypothetical protein